MNPTRQLQTISVLFLVALLRVGTPAPAASDDGAPTVVEPSAVEAVAAVLDDFHRAAADADEARYFGHLAPGAVFLGTDAKERWSKREFRDFVHPYFSRGQGWTYEAVERHVSLSADGSVAWFDEHLENSTYGTCRGSGSLQLRGSGWKIEQYNLTIPLPNELTKELVARIRQFESERPR